MDIQKLKCFMAAAEFCSLTKAAEQLYLTQPTVSKYVSSLENELGVQLFIRQNRYIKLTPQGQYLFKQGRALLKQIDNIESNLQSINKGISGKLSLVAESFENETLISLIRSIYDNYPSIDFKISHETFEKTLDMLENDEADLGIVRSILIDQPVLSRHYCIKALHSEHINVMVPFNNPLSKKSSLTFDDLVGSHFYLVKSPYFNPPSNFLPKGFLDLKIQFDEIPAANEEDALFQVLCGKALCFAGRLFRKRYVNECRFLELEGFDMNIDALLLWRKDNANPAVNTFIETSSALYPDTQIINSTEDQTAGAN